jgi:hypothetical protein
VVEFFHGQTVAMLHGGRNMQQRKLKIRHVNAFRVDIDGGHVQVLLIIDTGLTHFVGERDDHGAAAGCGFLRGDKSAFGEGIEIVACVYQGAEFWLARGSRKGRI